MQYELNDSLPRPDALSAQHSANVGAHIRQKIAASNGIISFAEFMHEALYAPGLGYYSAGSTKFGEDGDFVTSPEVSPVFGRIVARQLAEILADIDDGEVLEVGAGSGRLAVDMLTELEKREALPTWYSILEVSADLQERQTEYLRRELPHLVDRIRWLQEMPTQFRGVIVANEVLDALPAERFVRRDAGIMQLCVAEEHGKFIWAERPANKLLASSVTAIEADTGQQLIDGYTSEVSLAVPAWIESLGQCLQSGAILLFDYGVSRREYYAVDRSEGWLRCHFRHHAHNDPLIYPGIQDLTVWVDFTAVASAAVAAGLDILGYQSQSQFLMGGGLELEMQGFEKLSVGDQLRLSGQIKTLTLPGEMGENFKCIALGRGDVPTPSAFYFADRTQSL